MATLQVKGMDDALYKALATRAAQENRSISQQVVAIIRDSLAQPGSSARRATEQFLALSGSWEDDRPVDEIVEDLRASRRSGRRFTADGDVPD